MTLVESISALLTAEWLEGWTAPRNRGKFEQAMAMSKVPE
jgi:hypothetical protein